MTQPDDDLERTVALLRRTLEQRVTPEVRARHLGNVQRKAAQMRFEQRRNQRAARRPRVALLAALVGAMLVGTSSAALAASGGSVPGDVLYPVKRGGEEVRLIVATPFSAQGGVQLDIATERVHEAFIVAESEPGKVVPLIEEAMLAIEAAKAVGQPEAAQVAADLGVQAEEALAIAEVPEDVVAAMPQGELSQEIASATAETDTTIALPDEPSRSGTLGAAPVAGDIATDPALAETVTAPSASPSPSPSVSPSPSNG